MKFFALIPARLEAQRLPRKPLREVGGKILVAHAYDRAMEAQASEALVATDSDEVIAACTAIGVPAVLTRSSHQNGTERCAEVARERGWPDDAIVVNVQGDEPLLPAPLIRSVAEGIAHSGADMATLSCPISDAAEFASPNAVKVVCDEKGRALLFSRAPIPVDRDRPTQAWKTARRHIGLYAYRVGALKTLAALPPCALEQSERLEQLRALWHGLSIQVIETAKAPPAGVDTAEDLERVARLFARNDAVL